MDNEKKTCSANVENFEALACVCGLSFPDSAKEFQKAILTLAHVMAALRESVLKGADIPVSVLSQMCSLADVAWLNHEEQR